MSAPMSEQNDKFRSAVALGLPCQTYPGRIVVTHGVQHLPGDVLREVLRKLAEFNTFTIDNDPYGEHDFGVIEHAGETYNWKIDYYDENYEYGSENPLESTSTRRVLSRILTCFQRHGTGVAHSLRIYAAEKLHIQCFIERLSNIDTKSCEHRFKKIVY